MLDTSQRYQSMQRSTARLKASLRACHSDLTLLCSSHLGRADEHCVVATLSVSLPHMRSAFGYQVLVDCWLWLKKHSFLLVCAPLTGPMRTAPYLQVCVPSQGIMRDLLLDAVFGPDDTPWEGGVFSLRITFTENYPEKPPRVSQHCLQRHFLEASCCFQLPYDKFCNSTAL